MKRLKLRLIRHIDTGITFVVRPFLRKKTRILVDRRDGIIRHYQLKRVFKKIGNDPYVKQSRIYYAENPSRYKK